MRPSCAPHLPAHKSPISTESSRNTSLNLSFRVSRNGPRNRRSLGFARDDSKESVVARNGQLLDERAAATPRHFSNLIWTSLSELSPGRQSWVSRKAGLVPSGMAEDSSLVFSRPSRDWSNCCNYPGLSSWAKFSRPVGTGAEFSHTRLGLFGFLWLCSREDVFERLALFVIEFWNRQRLSRQHLIAHSGVVDEYGFDHSCLLQIRRG